MAAAVTFAGIGSGMDVEGLITGLMGVERQSLSRVQSKKASAEAAVTELSSLSTLLSTLKTAASELDTLQDVGSYTTTSTNADAAAISANGNAQPGEYSVEVLQVAQTARRYSDAFASASSALGVSGQLTLQIGTGDLQSPSGTLLVGAATTTIDIAANDTLDSVIQKINSSGQRVQASSFFDGTAYRLSLRGLDTGDANALTVSGLDLGLNTQANIVSQAQDAKVKIDGFLVSSSNNQISQAVPGVSLAVKKVTTSPFTIAVNQDPDGLAKKLTTFVDAYNGVIQKVHSAAGFGKQKASNPLLAGDSAMRGIASRLSSSLTQTFGSAAANTLSGIGVKLNNDGTLRLDQTKLTKVLSDDPSAVTRILAGDESLQTSGIMDALRDLTSTLTDPTNGPLTVRKEGFEGQTRRYADQITRENLRLERVEARMRSTFNSMDSSVASSNAQLAYVQANL
jgi:flagellar hook-associated protein 2